MHHRELIERFVAAWRRCDLDEVMACVSDDITFITAFPQPATIYQGREEVRGVWAGSLGDDPGTVWLPLIIADEHVVAPWDALEKDGTRIRGVDLYTVRDGLITTKDVYTKLV